MTSITIESDEKVYQEPFWTSSPRKTVGWALIDVGQVLAKGFFVSCEKLALTLIQPKDPRILQVFKRAIAALCFTLLGVLFLPGWIVGSCLKMVGTALSGVPYIYLKGKGKEAWNEKGFSLLSYNCCMYESGFPMLLGGVMPASYRIDSIAKRIKQEDPDIVLLQEMSLGPSENLIEKLKDHYPHFFTNIGNPTAWIQSKTVGPELFIASKAPLVSEPLFIRYTAPEASQKMGFFCLETPSCWVINAHFPEENQELCLKQIYERASQFKKPFVLVGDLNYRKEIPKELFFDPRKEDNAPTCSNVLAAKMFGKPEPEIREELDDFILVDAPSHKKGLMNVEEIKLLKEKGDGVDPWTAESDHFALKAKISCCNLA